MTDESTPAAQARHAGERVPIERGVPMPILKVGRMLGEITLAIRALAASEIGDSILIGDKTTKQIGPYINSAGHGIGWAVTRTVVGGTRIWKFAEPTK